MILYRKMFRRMQTPNYLYIVSQLTVLNKQVQKTENREIIAEFKKFNFDDNQKDTKKLIEEMDEVLYLLKVVKKEERAKTNVRVFLKKEVKKSVSTLCAEDKY